MSAFTLDVGADRIAKLVFDLPGEKVNKFSAPVIAELDRLIGDLEQRSDVRALVITSGKSDIFIAGADIKELQAITTTVDGLAKAQAGQQLFQRLAKLKFPTIAVIDGACMGGGLELALACTYRVVSDHEKCSLALPEVTLGILPGWGGTQRLPRLIGLPQALDMILSGKPVNGPKAFKLHLADHCCARAFLADEVPGFVAGVLTPEGRGKVLGRRGRGFVDGLIGGPAGRWYVFMKAHKSLMAKTKGLMPAPLVALEVVRASSGIDLERGLEIEAKAFASLAPTPECKCLIDCFFANESIRKEGAPKATREVVVAHAAVLGAGVMGGGIAWLFSQHGVQVRLKDIAWEAIARGLATANDYNGQLVKLRKLTPSDASLRMHRIGGTVDHSGFAASDVVIEAVVENMEVKKKVLAEVEGHVRADALLCSNTSSLSITEMGTALKNPERFVGLHFFNPVNRMPLVEVIPGARSSPEAVAAAATLSRRLGKTAVVVKDCPGFLVNRILLPYLNEAARLLQDGADFTEIDRVIAGFGMPMGPFTLTDEVGIDVGWKVAKILAAGYGERMKVAELLTSVHEQFKLLGAKGGRGFYLHSGGKRHGPNPDIDAAVAGVRDELNLKPRDVPAEEIIERCLLTMVNESARCIEEQVIAKPLFLDLAMVMGTGFPPQRGGPLHYADQLGIATVVDKLKRLRERCGERFEPCPLLVAMAAKGERFIVSG